MSRALLAALAATIALGGCTAEPPAGTGEAAGPEAAQPPAMPGNGTLPAALLLEGCVHWQARLGPLPRALLPGDAPAGWEPKDPSQSLGAVGAMGFLCDKAAIGPFERGPVAFLLDVHANADIPEACMDATQGATGYQVLHRILASDADIGAYLAQAYGMPAQRVDVQPAPAGVGPLELQRWDWTPDGGEPSSISIPRDPLSAPDTAWERFFWETEGRIAALELRIASANPYFGGRVAEGTFGAPMLLSEAGSGTVAMKGAWSPSAQASGQFRSYADMLCEVPQP